MKYLIKNGLILLWDGKYFYINKENIYVNDAKIERIGDLESCCFKNCEIVDAKNKLIMPGLINMHTHVYMNFMKNFADDLPFNTWLYNKILPIEAKMNDEDFYWGTLLGCIEMIKTGTTTYFDMHISKNGSAKAANHSGMRAFVGKCMRGNDIFSDAAEDFKLAIEEKEKYENELTKFVLSPHSIYACTSNLLRQIETESRKQNLLKHIHLSESWNELDNCLRCRGKTPVKYLSDIGFLDNKTIAAHCVKINDNDIKILKEKKVSIVTNPSSNAKLGNGIAPITKMLKHNINICLGTDSAASNNTLNMFREMNFFSLIHKAEEKNSQTLSAQEVLNCCLINSAEALGFNSKLGIIKEGCFADLIFIDLKTPSLFPNNDIISSLCYSANGSEINSVMINGKFVLRDKQLTTIDEERVYFEVDRMVNKYLK